MKHSLEWVGYCNKMLSPIEVKYLFALSAMRRGVLVTAGQLNAALGNNELCPTLPESAKLYLEALYHKGMINFRLVHGGFILDWLRSTVAEKRPGHAHFQQCYELWNNDKKELARIPRGSVASFCRKNGLDKTATYRLLHRQVVEHRGWVLVKDGHDPEEVDYTLRAVNWLESHQGWHTTEEIADAVGVVYTSKLSNLRTLMESLKCLAAQEPEKILTKKQGRKRYFSSNND